MRGLGFVLNIIATLLGFFLAKIPHFGFLLCVKGLSFLFFALDRRRYKDAMANLNFVFGESYSHAQKHAIIKRCYQNLAFIILESVRLPYLDREKYLARFDFEGKEFLFDLLSEEKKVVLVSAHYGYWEALGTAIPLQMQKELPNHANYEMFSLGRLTDFASVNEMIIKRRETFGVKLIDKKGAFKQLLKIYTRNAVGTGILIDQNISLSEGVEIEFFGKRATQTTITSVLSRRFDAYLVPILIDFNADYTRFKICISAPIKAQQTSDMQRDILEATCLQAQIIEDKIKENPASWFWFHKRWKSFYPEIYAKISKT